MLVKEAIMSLTLTNLDEQTRRFMLEEIDTDVANARLYMSPRLSSIGRSEYENLLREAVQSHDVSWLAEQLRINERMNSTEQRKTNKGTSTVKVPVTAPDMLAEGEFNHFYIRGLCRRAIETNTTHLIIYRAKDVSHPRPESQAKLGAVVAAQKLLDDLRTHIGVDTALGLPAGPNSGLSVRLPE